MINVSVLNILKKDSNIPARKIDAFKCFIIIVTYYERVGSVFF